VRSSSFHHGYNVAIGAFGTDFLEVKDNVVHHTVGPGIQMGGSSHSLINNLVVYSIAEGTYEVTSHHVTLKRNDINTTKKKKLVAI